MKKGIHPKWYPDAKVICACGHTWTVGSTVPEIRTDVCSKCHPFFTGEQRIVDTEGQVDRFYKRLQARDAIREELERQRAARTSPERPMDDFGLSTKIINALRQAGITTAGQMMEKLAEGEEAVLEIPGIGRKALVDIRKRMRAEGYAIPSPEAQSEE